MSRSLILSVVGVTMLFSLSPGQASEPQRLAQKKAQPVGFPILPPISDADPSTRQEEVFRLPIQLLVLRTKEQLSVAADPTSVKPVKLKVGRNMVTGLKTALFIYRDGKLIRSGGEGLQGGAKGNTIRNIVFILNRRTDKLPRPGEKYAVEVRLTLFETDIPPQHMWSPESGRYKVLWTKTLRQEVDRKEACLPVGQWSVEFANGVTEVCGIRKDGTASVVEPRRRSDGKISPRGDSIVIAYDDDRVERWTPVGKRMVVEHWYPGSALTVATPVLGIAEIQAPFPSEKDSTAKLLKDLNRRGEDLESAHVRAAAIDLLGKRKAVVAVPRLIDLLADGTPLEGSDNWIGGHAANALETITGAQLDTLVQAKWRQWWKQHAKEFAPALPRPAANLWSKPVNGLAGRLRIDWLEEGESVRADVMIEFKNLSSAQSLAVSNLFGLEARVLDQAGKEIKDGPVLTSATALVPRRWGIVPLDASLGFPGDLRCTGSETPPQWFVKGKAATMQIGGQQWTLRPGRYLISARLTAGKPKDGKTPSAGTLWAGGLDLPLIPILVPDGTPPT